MKTKKLMILFLISSSLLVGVLMTSSTVVMAEPNQDDSLSDILDRGYLIVGSDTAYAPFESINPATELPVGFDMDMAQQVAAAMEVNLTVKSSAWDPIIPNLKSKKFDVIISAMTITEAREEEVDFTRWYYQSFQGILVPDGNPKGVVNITDLEESGFKVGFQSGTTSHIYFNDTLEPAGALGSPFEEVPLAIEALKIGNVDAVLADIAVLIEAAAETGSGVETIDNVFSPEDFGFATREEDNALTAKLNDILDVMLGTDESAPVPSDVYNTMYNKWFSEPVPDYINTSMTTATLETVELVYEPEGAVSPGFEFLAVLLAIPLVALIRKKKTQ